MQMEKRLGESHYGYLKEGNDEGMCLIQIGDQYEKN